MVSYPSVTAKAMAINKADTINHTPSELIPDSLSDDWSDVNLDEVVVTGLTGAGKRRYSAVPITVVSNTNPASQSPVNIIASLSRQPGVSQITTGNGISKPVIRGLGFNRVLVVNDGVRQEGQQWGDEHGVEVDGNAVSTTEIIKGPASLMYGSDAMAGVIVFNDNPAMSDGRLQAVASGGYSSNNGLADYSLDFRGNRNGLLWDWRWSQSFAHDYMAPVDGYVPGTGFRNRALKGMLGLNRSWGMSKLIMSYYHFTPEITEVGEELVKGSASYTIEMPYQIVGHYKIVSDNSFNIGPGVFKAILGYQQNRRREFEEHQHDHEHRHSTSDHNIDDSEAALDFRLQTVNYDLRYISPLMDGWKYNIGANGMWQSSSNLGTEFLIPAYRLADAGVFVTATKSLDAGIHLSGGIRYDFRHIHSNPLVDNGQQRFIEFTRNFSAVSGSLGATFEVSRNILLRANMARGFRAPNMSEMGSNGIHHGTFRYEIGNSDLKAEHSWQFDIGAELSGNVISGQIALFANRIDNYIYLRRTEELRDDTPVYHFISKDARLLGGELTIDIHPLRNLHFYNSMSIVDARLNHPLSDEEKFLPYIPAPRWLSSVYYDIPHHISWFGHTFAQIEADMNARQSHVMTAGGTETPTNGYVLWNISFGTDICLSSGRRFCQLAVNVDNLFNRAYQSHTSRLKYADTYPLTGRFGYNNIGRNVTVRVNFPFDL